MRPPDLTTFGARIDWRARRIECPFCTAKPGKPCRTRTGNVAQMHHDRWLTARRQLIDEGDGPYESRLRSVP
jgi:hypothetical protein